MIILMCCVWIVLQVGPVLLQCDNSKNTEYVHEGNIGDVEIFPWIGVLRAKIFSATESKVALTGIVLVREKFCIGYANDVAKISKRTLEDTTRAMFIPADEKPLYAKVKDYMVHPEYDYTTMNTVALIELDLDYGTHFPVTPICWPPMNYNTTELYVIGYTDENKFLEKMLYKVDYVSQQACQEFYDRQQIQDRVDLKHPICAFAKNNKKNCEWDTGMVLASNATGIWTLIGFSLEGPGCSAPSRFIDLTKYLNWIETTSSLEPEDNTFRKSGGDTELHDDGSSKVNNDKNGGNNFSVQRIASNAININFNTTADSGECYKSELIVYSEYMPLRSNKSELSKFSLVLLKIPIIDLMFRDYNCISLVLEPSTYSAYLWYNITLQKIVSGGTSKLKGEHYTIRKCFNAILYLKLKFILGATLKYLVYGKENIVVPKNYKLGTNKRLNKFKNNQMKSAGDKIIASKKFKFRKEGAEYMSETDWRKINKKINGTEEYKETNLLLALKSDENNNRNGSVGNYNNIKSLIVSMYDYNVAMNVYISLLIIFAIVYIIFGVLIRKGYVRL